MKFKLQCIDDFEGSTVTHEFESEVWYGCLDQFVKFLRGAGYDVGNNSVGINLGGNIKHWFLDDYTYGNITFFDSTED